MKRRVEDWSVRKLNREQHRISFPEYQREKSLWSDEKKRLLIDSILRDIDIPKLYFNELKDKSIEVVDGQQRLWSVWEFLNDEFAYEIDSKKHVFSKLSGKRKNEILDYEFQVIIFEDADEEYLRELFVRLQLGLLLTPGEKLHAAAGRMKRFVFSTLAEHDFVKALGIPNRRYAKETLAAQISINSFFLEKNASFSRTRYDDLINFFKEYADPRGKDLELFRSSTDRIVDTLDKLWIVFKGKSKNLKNRSFILSIYLFFEQNEIASNEYTTFSNFAFTLWERLREESRAGMDRTNRELYSFQSLLSSAPGEEYQIRRRHEKLAEFYDFFKSKGKIKGD